MQRLLSIQLLRALAALMVVTFHVSGSSWLVGAAGVDIFFVISGLVMWIVTALPNVRPSTFAFDRLARILPLYWICTLVLAVTSLALPKIFPSLSVTPGWLIASLLLWPSYEPGTSHIWPVLAQGWTLTYEMLFYAILLLAQLLDASRRTLFVTGAILGLVVLGILLPPDSAALTVYTNPLLLEFLAGYWLGKLATAGLLKEFRSGYMALTIAVIGFGAAIVNGSDPSGWMRLLQWGLPALALVAAAMAFEPVIAALFKKATTSALMRLGALLGDASYAIYLTHGFAISVLKKLWGLAHLPQPHSADIGSGLEAAYFAVALVACAIVGILVHLTLERWIILKLRPFRPLAKKIATA